MKRSEAVLRIAEHLIEPKSDDVMVQAGMILAMLVKRYGMLPPGVVVETDNGKEYVHAWEAEEDDSPSGTNIP